MHIQRDSNYSATNYQIFQYKVSFSKFVCQQKNDSFYSLAHGDIILMTVNSRFNNTVK